MKQQQERDVDWGKIPVVESVKKKRSSNSTADSGASTPRSVTHFLTIALLGEDNNLAVDFTADVDGKMGMRSGSSSCDH